MCQNVVGAIAAPGFPGIEGREILLAVVLYFIGFNDRCRRIVWHAAGQGVLFPGRKPIASRVSGLRASGKLGAG